MLLFNNFSLSALSIVIIVLFFGMGLHEFGHAFAADWWGDPTPRKNGKLTLNPLAHINWEGWIWIMLIGFGMAGSVAYNPYNLRDRRWGSFWVSIAGPLMNLLQAIIFGILFRLFGNVTAVAYMLGYQKDVWELGQLGINPVFAYLSLLFYIGVWFNVFLFIFNLIPLHPLDGYRAMLSLLPGYFLSGKQIPSFIHEAFPPLSRFLQQPAYIWKEWQQVTLYVFIGLIMLSFLASSTGLHQLNLLGFIISGPSSQLMTLLAGIGA
jgi:Zn-dependent protease